jgi:ATP-dependent DNA ligase
LPVLAKATRPALERAQLTSPGDIVFRHACRLGLEGIVSKRLGSPALAQNEECKLQQ